MFDSWKDGYVCKMGINIRVGGVRRTRENGRRCNFREIKVLQRSTGVTGVRSRVYRCLRESTGT